MVLAAKSGLSIQPHGVRAREGSQRRHRAAPRGGPPRLQLFFRFLVPARDVGSIATNARPSVGGLRPVYSLVVYVRFLGRGSLAMVPPPKSFGRRAALVLRGGSRRRLRPAGADVITYRVASAIGGGSE